MADNDDKSKNVNKSIKPINGVSADYYENLEAKRTTELGRSSARQQELQQRLDKTQEELVERLMQVNGKSSEQSQAQIGALSSRASRLQEELSQADAYQISRVNEDIASGLERYTRPKDVNARTTTISRSYSLGRDIRSDRALIGSTPTELLENRIQQNMSRVSELGSYQAEDIRSMGSSAATPEMESRAKEMQVLEKKIAEDKKIIAIQVKEGLTSEKQFYGSKELETRVKGYLGHRELESSAAGGQFGSLEENVKKLSDILSEATEAVKRFEEVTSDTSSATEEERKNAFRDKEQAQQKLKTQYDIVGILGRGGVGGGRDDRLGNIAAVAGGAASIIGNIGVTQEVKNLSLKSAYANVVNDLYLKSEKAAIGGDLNAALSLNSIDAIEAKRKELSINKAGSGALEVTAQSVMGVAAGYAGNAGGAAAGVSGAINTAADLLSGNAQAAAGLQGIQSMQALDESTRFIRTRQMQSYYNLGLSSYQGVAGLGGAGGEMQRSLVSNKNIGSTLANSGVSPQDAIQLMPLLGEAGAFSATQGIDIMGRAGATMQKGQMTREAYVSSAAAIMGQGGASGDLETIIQNAMQRGMDNSKNISQMVSATLSLNANIAKSGVGAVSELEKLMDSSVSGLSKFGLDKNLITPMAQTGLSNLDNMLRSTDINFGNVSEMSILTKTFSGASIDQIQQLATMGIGDMAKIKGALGGDEQSILSLKAQMEAAGTSSLLFDKEGRLMEDKARAAMDANMSSMIVNKTSHLGISADDVKAQLKSGKVEEKIRAAMNLGAPGTTEAAISVLNTAASTDKKQIPPPNNIGADQQVTSAKFQLEQAFQGKEFLDGIAKAAELNVSAMDVAQSIIKTAAEIAPADKWNKMANDAAASFSIPVNDFKNVVNNDLKKLLQTNQAVLNEVLKKLDVSVSMEQTGYGDTVRKNDERFKFR